MKRLLPIDGNLITRFTVTDYPISIASTTTNGWKDLVLTSNGKEHLMKFNGKSYPSNPSVQVNYTSNAEQALVKGLNATDQFYNW